MLKLVVSFVLTLGCVARCQEYSSSAFNQMYPILSSRSNSQSELKLINELRQINQNFIEFDKNVFTEGNFSHVDTQISFKYNIIIELIIYSVKKIFSFIPILDVFEGSQKGLSTAITCLACHSLSDILFSAYISTNMIAQVVVRVCTALRIPYVNGHVCKGFINLFKDHLDYIRRNTRLESTQVCGILLGVHCSLSSGTCFQNNQTKSDNLCWRLPLNATKSGQIKTKNKNNVQNKLRILHLTDIHLDLDYVPYEGNGCGQPYCCRADKAKDQNANDTGYWGSYYCDPPMRTVYNLFENIDWKSYDLVYWTGDVSPHTTWEDTWNETITNSRIITNLLKIYSTSPVIVAIGNHMAVPVGTYPPPEIHNELSVRPLYKELAEEMSEWMDDKTVETFTRAGYYSIRKFGFRIIVLNSNYCSRLNIWTLYNSIDPADHLKWLITELSIAEEAGELVHIVGHIPPDNRECTQSWIYNYLRIVERYNETIVAQFFGHTHFDEFRSLHSVNDCSKPIGFEIVSPSFSTFDMRYKLNPAYRVIVAQHNGRLIDMETYMFDLIRANQMISSKPEYVFEYSMANDYSIELNNNGFHQLLENIIRDNYYLRLFFAHYVRQEFESSDYCNDDCKSKIIDDLKICNPFYSLPKPITSVG